MKLPSLTYLIRTAQTSLALFPLVIASSAVAVTLGIYLTEEYDDIQNIFPMLNAMLCAAIGIPLYFSSTVFCESKHLERTTRVYIQLAATLLLVVLYFTFPDKESTHNVSVPYIRYTVYNITVHLLVAFIPFLQRGQLNGFWQYNRILFLRFLLSVLYSGVLYAGLAIALGSLDFLFDIDLHEKLFFDLFILIGGLFNTWFFVSGMPQRFDELESLTEYPRGIKVFCQYVLFPLLILYLVILYLYAAKIVIQWNWPKGLVSYLIACVAVLGILNLLLVHPYGNLPGNTWISRFSRIYYVVLMPLVVLLFIAVGMRIGDYGITINRYIIVLLGVWLTITCIYFASGRTNIKFIPVSLAAILVACSFGYWGMFSVSERSQVQRLRTILENNNILEDGKIENEVLWIPDSLPLLFAAGNEHPNDSRVNDSLHSEIRSILSYLDDNHGFESIRSWYRQDIDSMIAVPDTTLNRWQRPAEAEAYMTTMGLSFYRAPSIGEKYFTYSADFSSGNITDVQGYDLMIQFDHNSGDTLEYYELGQQVFALKFPTYINDDLILSTGDDRVSLGTSTFLTRLMAGHGTGHSGFSKEEMTLTSAASRIRTRLELESVGFRTQGRDTIVVYSMKGNLLIDVK